MILGFVRERKEKKAETDHKEIELAAIEKNAEEKNEFFSTISHDTIVSIKDNGIGIDKEFLPHLYEPFAQEKRAGYEASGTGLGLAIVKRIVELMLIET